MSTTLRSARDSKGYYAVLGLAPGAELSAIKTAYRERVKEVHPDRNASAGAAEEFQKLSEAYQVLRDMVRRAEYDSAGSGSDAGMDDDDLNSPAIPLACGTCGKVTAQPRYVVFHRVKSYLLWAKRFRLEGIFCRDCADRAAVRASTSTWAWGWWSPPGLILTPLALIRNMLGGTKPARDNARLLIRQARAFFERGELDIARSLTDQAVRYARDPASLQRVEDLRFKAAGFPGRRLKDRWRLGGGAFLAQLMPLVALPVVAGVFVLIWNKPWDQPVAAGVAGIHVVPAEVGEIRHVAVTELKVRQAPGDTAPVVALLDRFATATVVAAPEDAQWTKVRTPAGILGWVPSRALYVGTGGAMKLEWCAENQGPRPGAGEALSRRASGDHRLMIHNDGRKDAVVKLKTQSGSTVVSYFIPATFNMVVTGIPEGTYLIEFATGSAWSRACGLFVDDMTALRMPYTVTFRHLSVARAASVSTLPSVTLIAAPGDAKAARSIDDERFIADD